MAEEVKDVLYKEGGLKIINIFYFGIIALFIFALAKGLIGGTLIEWIESMIAAFASI